MTPEKIIDENRLLSKYRLWCIFESCKFLFMVIFPILISILKKTGEKGQKFQDFESNRGKRGKQETNCDSCILFETKKMSRF